MNDRDLKLVATLMTGICLSAVAVYTTGHASPVVDSDSKTDMTWTEVDEEQTGVKPPCAVSSDCLTELRLNPANRLGTDFGDVSSAACVSSFEDTQTPTGNADANTAYPSLAKP